MQSSALLKDVVSRILQRSLGDVTKSSDVRRCFKSLPDEARVQTLQEVRTPS